VKLDRKSMTSFCRLVIAMRMIVANKRRIASSNVDHPFDKSY
jgi:hypothetical protein